MADKLPIWWNRWKRQPQAMAQIFLTDDRIVRAERFNFSSLLRRSATWEFGIIVIKLHFIGAAAALSMGRDMHRCMVYNIFRMEKCNVFNRDWRKKGFGNLLVIWCGCFAFITYNQHQFIAPLVNTAFFSAAFHYISARCRFWWTYSFSFVRIYSMMISSGSERESGTLRALFFVVVVAVVLCSRSLATSSSSRRLFPSLTRSCVARCVVFSCVVYKHFYWVQLCVSCIGPHRAYGVFLLLEFFLSCNRVPFASVLLLHKLSSVSCFLALNGRMNKVVGDDSTPKSMMDWKHQQHTAHMPINVPFCTR